MSLQIILLVVSLLVLISAKQLSDNSNRGKGFAGRGFEQGTSDASIVRQLLHDADYTALTGQIIFEEFKDYSAANIQLITDGPKDKSTGIPYFYMHKNDPSAISARQGYVVSALLNEGVIEGRCDNLPFGIKDNACPIAELFGKMEEIPPQSEEGREVRSWFEEKYSAFANLGVSEKAQYELWKLNIEHVFIGDNGVPKKVEKTDYFNATTAKWIGL